MKGEGMIQKILTIPLLLMVGVFYVVSQAVRSTIILFTSIWEEVIK